MLTVCGEIMTILLAYKLAGLKIWLLDMPRSFEPDQGFKNNNKKLKNELNNN